MLCRKITCIAKTTWKPACYGMGTFIAFAAAKIFYISSDINTTTYVALSVLASGSVCTYTMIKNIYEYTKKVDLDNKNDVKLVCYMLQHKSLTDFRNFMIVASNYTLLAENREAEDETVCMSDEDYKSIFSPLKNKALISSTAYHKMIDLLNDYQNCMKVIEYCDKRLETDSSISEDARMVLENSKQTTQDY